ncbi:hypothetical protein BFU36_13315 [Sulfolobus sp. A20]|uniref:TM1812 family CRISPR-associated protein n=1 Tax=Sulfolobaceae TaxID=118883 RepID=UPI00084627CB|nr:MULTISPECIES: TM1812 family CRISPR-associated protein [unclassified Sulfolobus]TRM76536.1 hypothetical protein DJ523_00880 [Sulfolobus sp. E5]TRM78985.1 hypothetical protein DJ528_03325 [Sulfolobus sp. B5]TRM84798.1 hypothetical protein DJ522_03340 [Sulfolobus sp. F3]TRM87593.1 hypothetical protein DJ529_07915 [Sulfolobus sp. C3]TRM89007.1 hypothetical protein DJ521_00750 [Sulfolobus sp. E3]TRN03506.1 hypothetical protein DJ527_01785 [Sulfolobus sp. F1]
MSSQKKSKCLVYLAGDVTNYKPITYRFEGKGVKTFFSAHALSKIFEVDKTIALLPDSLLSNKDIAGNKLSPDDINTLKEGYKKLISDRAESLLGENKITKDIEEDIKSLVDKLEIEVIPNVGIGQAIKVNSDGQLEKDNKGYKRVKYSTSRSPVFIFNTIYTILHDLSENNEVFIDLTHGTNVLTSITMAVGALFKSRFFASPIMGAPSQDEVDIVELTDIVESMKDSLMIVSSIEKLDDRYFRDYISRLKNINPQNFNDNEKEVIDKIKAKDPNRVIDLLWNLRNGFTVNAINSMNDVSKYLSELKDDVSNLSNFYREWYDHPNLENIKEIVISNFYSTLNVNKIIISGKDDIERLRELVQLYINASIYDKALSLARELPVAKCLNDKGGGVFDDNDGTYKECDEITNDILRNKHSAIMQLRNYLVHGGLSKDMKTEVRNGEIKANVQISKKKIEEYVKGSLTKDLDDVMNKIM